MHAGQWAAATRAWEQVVGVGVGGRAKGQHCVGRVAVGAGDRVWSWAWRELTVIK